MSTRAKALASIDQALDTRLRPRKAQGGKAAGAATQRAQHLACMVRDEGPDTIGPYLDALSRAQLYAIAVTLAAMVDLDKSLEEHLAWLEPRGRDAERTLNRERHHRPTAPKELAS